MSSNNKAKQKDEEELPLPPGWTKAYSKSQKRYFWNHLETKTSQWHPPTKEEAEDPIMAKKKAEQKAKLEREQIEREKKAKRKHGSSSSSSKSSNKKKKIVLSDDDASGFSLAETTSVAIIVPFRDLHPEQNRSEHLKKFVPHMLDFLRKLQISKQVHKNNNHSNANVNVVEDYHIYIVEQSNDGRKFNRGKLLNIGFDYAKRTRPHDVFIFHDVDLLPADDLGSWYARFPRRPIHIARCWDRYSNNPKYFGGIVSFSASDMRRINGYPNTFWGWGGEDDEMQKRCERLGIAWEAPPKGTIKDLEDMSLSEKLDFLRSHKSWKCMVKWEALDEHESTWKQNGLKDLRYSVLSTTSLDPNGNKATKISCDVELNGDHWSNAKCGVDFKG